MWLQFHWLRWVEPAVFFPPRRPSPFLCGKKYGWASETTPVGKANTSVYGSGDETTMLQQRGEHCQNNIVQSTVYTRPMTGIMLGIDTYEAAAAILIPALSSSDMISFTSLNSFIFVPFLSVAPPFLNREQHTISQRTHPDKPKPYYPSGLNGGVT